MTDWKNIPSPFYRVSVKAFIFDDKGRLLMGEAPGETWEPPGGGLEHGESIEECLQRELNEELGVGLSAIGRPIVAYTGLNKRGFRAIKIAIEATLSSDDFTFTELIGAKYVTKEELLGLSMSTDEEGIKGQVDKIWPASA